MNQKLFIIIIILLIINLLYKSNKINKIENMQDCSSINNTILQNPIFKDIKNLNENKLYKYLIDFNNNVIDNKILLKDILDNINIKKLEKIINSYRVSNPITNIILQDTTNLKDIKNEILKNIILNNLQCINDNDPELFWIKLHLLNKEFSNFKINLKSDPIIEMFNNENKDYNLKNSKIISFNKHQKNIAIVLIKKYTILKDILKDFSLVYKLQLHEIILQLLDYLVNKDNISKKITKQIKDIYIDLRELILINQIMENNPNLQIGLSKNGNTFILDHNIYINNITKFKQYINKFDIFSKIFNSHLIIKSKQDMRKIFLNKIIIYLKYNGIKIDNEENYHMLNINSINLKNLNLSEKILQTVNTEFIDYLKIYDTNINKDKINFSFRIKYNLN